MYQVECQFENTELLVGIYILFVNVFIKLPVQEQSLSQGTGIGLFPNKKEKLYTEPIFFLFVLNVKRWCKME